jgi:hypothetical protein
VLTVEADVGSVERRLTAGGVSCPGCGGRLAPWGWARPRVLRGSGVTTLLVRPRRACCRGCDRTHVLLPVVALVRRADLVEVIGAALAARAAGAGCRRIAAGLGRPVDTVRGWLRCGWRSRCCWWIPGRIRWCRPRPAARWRTRSRRSWGLRWRWRCGGRCWGWCRRGWRPARRRRAGCWPRAGLDRRSTRVASPGRDLGLALSSGLSTQDPRVVVVLALVEVPWTSVVVRRCSPAWLLDWLLGCDTRFSSSCPCRGRRGGGKMGTAPGRVDVDPSLMPWDLVV